MRTGSLPREVSWRGYRVEGLRQPLVSIVIPTFGRPEDLKRAIESATAQTYRRCEVIVVDDNDPSSPFRQATEVVMEDYRAADKVRYVKHPVNRNGAAARNTGVRESHGDYVCFLDDDDHFLPTKVEAQAGLLASQTEYDAVSCGWSKHGVCHEPPHDGDLTRELLLLDYVPITSTLMFRRQAFLRIGGFDESFSRHQDLELMLRYFRVGRIVFIRECLVEVGTNSGSNALQGEALDSLKRQFLMRFADTLESLEGVEPGISGRIVSRHYARALVGHLRRGHIRLAGRSAMICLESSPLELVREVLRVIREYTRIILFARRTS